MGIVRAGDDSCNNAALDRDPNRADHAFVLKQSRGWLGRMREHISVVAGESDTTNNCSESVGVTVQ